MRTIQGSNEKRTPTSPDVGYKKKAVKVAIVVILVAMSIGGGYFGYSRFASKSSTNEESSLQTATATRGDLALYANGTGTIVPAAEANLGFSTSGQVSDIYVQVGDRVEAGQVLAQLDDAQVQVQLAEAQEAMSKLTSGAALATAKQSLAAAQSSFDTAREVLAYLISPEVLYWEEEVAEREQVLAEAQAAKQNVTEAETSLEHAQAELSYFQKVYDKTYVSANFTQYRTMSFRGRTVSEVITVEDEETGEISNLVYPPTEGEIGTARADYELAEASIAEARTYLDVLNGAEIPEEATGDDLLAYIETRHALQTAEYNLNATKLIAPIRGRVTALEIKVGDFADGASVITLSNLDQPYSLDVYLAAKDWGQVKIGYQVEVAFDILPGETFTGTVTGVYPMLDTSSFTKTLVHITARLDGTIPYELPGGSSASVDVIGGRAENAVLVPVEALHEIEDGKYSLFVMENGKLRLRVVAVGVQDLTNAEILSGLDAGEVVTTGVVKTK